MSEILKFEFAHYALKFLINKYNITSMHIPYYLCDVVRHTLVSEGCKPLFYHIDDDFLPVQKFLKEDYILYPNYFGICDNNVEKLSLIYPKLIVDNAHAYYSKPQGFACFNSAYKFGLGDYSNLWIGDNFQELEFDTEKLNLRKSAFIEAHKKYGKTNLLKINLESVPFCYPYLASDIKEADNLANVLKNQGKNVYRYWNPLPQSYNEYKFYSRLVPVPLNL